MKISTNEDLELRIFKEEDFMNQNQDFLYQPDKLAEYLVGEFDID
ncbi:MAG: hypothetical protein ABSH16_05740 [Sedimentisphaerales bacterium]